MAQVFGDYFSENESKSISQSSSLWEGGYQAVAMSINEDDEDDDIRAVVAPYSPMMRHRRPMKKVDDVIHRRSFIADPLTKCEIWSYGVGHIFNDMCAACWFSYLLVLLQDVHDLKPELAAFVILSGQIADAIATPIVAMLSDASVGWKCLGRRKLYYVIGTVVQGLGYTSVFMVNWMKYIVGDEKLKKNPYITTVYMCVMASLFNFGWAAIQVSHGVFVVEMTDNKDEQTQLNSTRYAMTVGSNLAIFGILWVAMRFTWFTEGSPSGDLTSREFYFMGGSSLLFGLFTSIWFVLGTSEPEQLKDGDAIVSLNAEPDSAGWKGWLTTFPFYIIMLNYMCTRLVVNVSQVFIPFYVTNYLEMSTTAIAIVPVVVYVSSFMASLAMRKANKDFGRQNTYIFGALLAIVAFFLYFILSPKTQNYVYIAAVLHGAANSTIMICSVQLQADLVGKNKANGAFVYGVHSFADKIANGFVLFILQRMNTGPTLPHIAETIIPGSAVILALFFVFLVPPSIYKKNKTRITKLSTLPYNRDRLRSSSSESTSSSDDDNNSLNTGSNLGSKLRGKEGWRESSKDLI